MVTRDNQGFPVSRDHVVSREKKGRKERRVCQESVVKQEIEEAEVRLVFQVKLESPECAVLLVTKACGEVLGKLEMLDPKDTLESPAKPVVGVTKANPVKKERLENLERKEKKALAHPEAPLV